MPTEQLYSDPYYVGKPPKKKIDPWDIVRGVGQGLQGAADIGDPTPPPSPWSTTTVVMLGLSGLAVGLGIAALRR